MLFPYSSIPAVNIYVFSCKVQSHRALSTYIKTMQAWTIFILMLFCAFCSSVHNSLFVYQWQDRERPPNIPNPQGKMLKYNVLLAMLWLVIQWSYNNMHLKCICIEMRFVVHKFVLLFIVCTQCSVILLYHINSIQYVISETH